MNQSNKNKKGMISRRQFARRAAILSATATIAPAAGVFAGSPEPSLPQQPADSTSPLSAESRTEAEARYQQILKQYGSRLSPEDEATVKRINLDLQSSLDRVRAYPLANGTSPAVYLKPLVEREKKAAVKPLGSMAKKP